MPHDWLRIGRQETSGARPHRAVPPLIAAALALLTLLGAVSATPPGAAADPCADVEVIFARGTFEPPGIGAIGEAFVGALRSRVGGRSIEVHPVDYPASLNFATAADGVVDASTTARDLASRCPDTAIVFGGYSQGAAVVGYVTEDARPTGYDLPDGITGPMGPEVADHVAAVALFGKPSTGFLSRIDRDAPPVTIGHLYTAKTLDQCIPDDPVCAPAGTDTNAHGRYVDNGMTTQAADFTAQHLIGHTQAPWRR